MERHFTATGVVVHGDSVLLIEHAKLHWWMPPGGHLEPNEDPVQAVVREVAEETGLTCEIVAAAGFSHDEVTVLPAPFTILVEDVPENGTLVQHIDCVYVMRPVTDPAAMVPQQSEVTGIRWVPAGEVGQLAVPPELPDLVRAALDYVAACAPADPALSP